MSTVRKRTAAPQPQHPSTTTTTSPISPRRRPPPSSNNAAMQHPLLPSPHELLLLATYPLILTLGSLYTTLSPPHTGAVYSPTHQSYQPPALAPSYFARKDNVLNVFFVKAGWAWYSGALLFFHAAHALFPLRRSASAAANAAAAGPGQTGGTGRLAAELPRAARAAARYAACTLAWALVTQWFFGPALIDRSFRLTGGSCAPKPPANGTAPDHETVRERLRDALSRAECAVEGGTWSGGIDISGHVFMLTLGSAMLCLEVLPVVVRWWDERGYRPLAESLDSPEDCEDEDEDEVGGKHKAASLTAAYWRGASVKVAAVAVGLSWWMLLMTAAFFHTWIEKLAGLVVALAAVWAVYFLPRGAGPVRLALGVPGG
jgi:hypothetical protein